MEKSTTEMQTSPSTAIGKQPFNVKFSRDLPKLHLFAVKETFDSEEVEFRQISGKQPFNVKFSRDLPKLHLFAVKGFFADSGSASLPPEPYVSEDSHAHLLRSILKVNDIQRGRLSCIFSVPPSFTNFYQGLHGGAVASIAERVSIACARTVVGEDKQLFLGELSVSYLSAATVEDLVTVEASVVRSGRNLSVVAAEFKIKKTGKLVYLARATFYHTSVSKL